MAATIPPPGTPARQAMLDQGSDLYPGVDQWHHPRQNLPVGKLLVQFDFRSEADIRKGDTTISPYFTDAETLLKHLTPTGEVRARELAEALQVKPYRPPNTQQEHLYSPRVTIYRVAREIKAHHVELAQPAEFGQGKTRNNLQYGNGVGTQYFLTEPKDMVLKGDTPTLQVADVRACVEQGHRLAWLQSLEQRQATDKQVAAAVAPALQQRVQELLRGSPAQQQRGGEIVELVQAKQRLQSLPPGPAGPKAAPAPPVPAPKPALASLRQRQRSPRF